MNKQELMAMGVSSAQADQIIAKSKFGGTLQHGGGRIPPGYGGGGPSQPTGNPGGVCGTSIQGAGEPYTIVSTTPIAAGALTADSNLAELFDASQSAQLSTDNKVNDNFVAHSLKMYVGVIAVDDGGVENIGTLLGQMYVREATGAGGGQEVAVWHLSDLGATVGAFGGFGTSTGGVGYAFNLNAPGIPWDRKYSTQGTYSLSLRISLTKTTVNVVDVTFVLSGRRFAAG